MERAFQERFLAYWDEGILQELRLGFTRATNHPWIVTMCLNQELLPTSNPLKYCMLIRFLCGGITRFIAIAEDITLERLPQNCPVLYPTIFNFAEKREQYRTVWLDACCALPGAYQSEVRKTASSTFAWLFRYDRGWLLK